MRHADTPLGASSNSRRGVGRRGWGRGAEPRGERHLRLRYLRASDFRWFEDSTGAEQHLAPESRDSAALAGRSELRRQRSVPQVGNTRGRRRGGNTGGSCIVACCLRFVLRNIRRVGGQRPDDSARIPVSVEIWEVDCLGRRLSRGETQLRTAYCPRRVSFNAPQPQPRPALPVGRNAGLTPGGLK